MPKIEFIFTETITMRFIALFVFIISVGTVFGQSNKKLLREIKKYQKEQSAEFADPETSILEKKDLATFKALDYYPPNLNYRVTAKFVRTPDEKPFLMPTTTDRKPAYVKYGELFFVIDGKDLKLTIYQNIDLTKKEGYEDYLFLPFTDLTSGDGSYGGGRYLDARIPEGDTMILDFNKAYNPYCAYNKKYSCPIPPKENDLLVRVEAGVKDFGIH